MLNRTNPENAFLPKGHPWRDTWEIPKEYDMMKVEDSPRAPLTPRGTVYALGTKVIRQTHLRAAPTWHPSHSLGAFEEVQMRKAVLHHPVHAAHAEAKAIHGQAKTARVMVTKKLGSIQSQILALVRSGKIDPAKLAKLTTAHDQAAKDAVKAAKHEAVAKVNALHAGARSRIVLDAGLPLWAKRILLAMVDMHAVDFKREATPLLAKSPSGLGALGAIKTNPATGYGMVGLGFLGIHPGRWAHELAKDAAKYSGLNAAESLAKKLGHDLKAAAKAIGHEMKAAAKGILALAKKGLCALGNNPTLLKAGLAAGAAAAGAPPTLALPGGAAGGMLPPGFASKMQSFMPSGESIPQMPGGGPPMSTGDVLGKVGDTAASIFKKTCPGDPDPGMGPDGGGGGGGLVIAAGGAAVLLALLL